MNEKEMLTEKFNIVASGYIDVSTSEKPIIGVEGLATCIGLLLYNKEHKKAIVAHIMPNQIFDVCKENPDEPLNNLETNIFGILFEQEMIGSSFDLVLVEGGDRMNRQYDSNDLPLLNDSPRRVSALELLSIKLKKINFMSINSVRFIMNEELTDEVHVSYDTDPSSREFAFDANSGEFVTNKVYFGKDYFRINLENGRTR